MAAEQFENRAARHSYNGGEGNRTEEKWATEVINYRYLRK